MAKKKVNNSRKYSNPALEFSDLDSTTELHFQYYLDELKTLGFIEEYINEPESLLINNKVILAYDKIIELKTKTKVVNVETLLIPEHKYTYDFKIKWNPKVLTHKLQKYFFINSALESYIEVKGDMDYSNMTRLFLDRTQPIIFEKYHKYIQLVKVPTIFKLTFTPDRYLLTDIRKTPRSIHFNTITFSQFENS